MTEKILFDSMGEVRVSSDKLWGAQTERSKENFLIGEELMPIPLLEALIEVKKAAARANFKTGKLATEKKEAIVSATEQIQKEKLFDHFPLKIWQTGSGTQTNMNANEVIATLASEHLFEDIHPNDDVNMSQSSNDVFPTAMHISFVESVEKALLPSLGKMMQQLQFLEAENDRVLKIGRTHLQDATPITFGQEISGWRSGIVHAKEMIESALTEMRQLAIGGTAVGTGLNASVEYVEHFLEALNGELGGSYREDVNKFHALASLDAEVQLSGALKALAANLMKMANDIRFLASGPRAGIGEIIIPSNEPGSSIMPGKVNPTQSEALTMVAIQVIGNDTTIGIAATQGNFELNVYMPVVAFNLLQSIRLLTDTVESFTEKCLIGLVANKEKMTENLEKSLMLVTALNPHIGYEKGAKIAKKAFEDQSTLKEAAVKLGFVTSVEYDAWVNPSEMV
jgi:fumarate hydratase class II